MKKKLNKEQKKQQEKTSKFLEEYRELSARHGLDFTAVIDVKLNGIKPVIVITPANEKETQRPDILGA